MSKVKIYGNPNPVIGIKEYYSIHDFFGSTAPSKLIEPIENIPDENIKWSVWILLGKEWVKMTKNNKTGATVDYTFYQQSLKRKGIRMLVDANGEKAVLDIKTKENAESKILHVEILDSNGKKPTKLFSYGETITARVHCLNMEKFRINLTLWENDGGKKDLSDISIETKEANVLNGIADVKFTFDPSKVWLANAKTAPNESNEGAFHEYYITAEFYKKVSKPTQDINVINPDYKVDILSKTSASKPSEKEKPSPAEQKGPSKKETRGIAKDDRKAHDYQEQKVDVKKEIWKDPFVEKINSYLTVNIGGYWGDKSKGKCVCKENNFYWSNKLTCDERKKVLEVCAKLWGEDKKKDKASELMAIMHLETGEKNMFKPYADNGADYSGLIQFSDASAKKLGTTRSALKKMTFIQQMDYVHDYFASKKEISNMVDLYLHVLKPNAVGNGNNPDYVLFDESISVPDGDGSQTSAKQRGINIGIEPWVTKYGYASNPSFMKGEEHTQRKKWVYTRQRFEDRWGFINGKTTVADVMLELKKEHYNPGAKYLFKGVCENVEEEEPKKSDGTAPWYPYAIKELKDFGGIRQTESPLKEKIYTYFGKSSYPAGTNETFWCAAFVNWCFSQVSEYKNTNPIKNEAALDWLPPTLAKEKRSNLDGWQDGELITNIEDAFPGTVIVFSYSHVAFLAGISKNGENLIYLGGNQSDGKKGDGKGKRTICTNPVSKKGLGTKFWLIKPKNYMPSDEEKILPKLSSDGEELNYEKSR